DTYQFGRGSGQDTITQPDSTPGNIDIIVFSDGIAPADVKPQLLWIDLKFTIKGTSDAITVENWLDRGTRGFGIEAVRCADGTTWGTEQIMDILLTGTDADDVMYGFSRADRMQGLGGNDTLSARGGADSLDGGTGQNTLFGEADNDTLRGGDGDDSLFGGPAEDILDGGPGVDTLYGGTITAWWNWDNANRNDTFLFGRGAGQDTVIDRDTSGGNIDTIRLADDLTPEDIELGRKGDNLELTINGTTDKLTVQNWFWNDSTAYQVERIQFSDGTLWDVASIRLKVLQGSSADDLLVGHSTAHTLKGYGADDRLYTRTGDGGIRRGVGRGGLITASANRTEEGGLGVSFMCRVALTAA
ncbi:MAG: hypothetical protein FJY85_13645, partial [Deltaproteobacteria bacterium]|nr:hypothetical protein [Deltaproteobacteria bacterium]